MAKPQAVQTTKRYEKQVVEDSLSKKQTTTGGGETTVSTTKKEEEEEQARKKMTQSRIPQRTTKVTTTTTADGFVQRTVETRRAEPVTEKTTSTTTTSYVQVVYALDLYPTNLDHYSHLQMSAARPFEPTTTQTQRTEAREERVVEDESRYRDSFIAASEGEGFWTDGAYTTSPSPPPIPRHRVLEEELREQKITDIGAFTTFRLCKPTATVYSLQIVTSGDTYSIVIDKARLEHAGYYKIVAENTRGKTESLTMLHVRPQSLIQHHKKNGHAFPSQKITEYRTPTEHTTVTEEFAMFEYEQRRPQKHETSRLVTPPPAKRFQAHRKDENCRTIHGGKYMCTARNASGVATSSAQLVIRPKTVAPDFIQRLISEEMVEGDQLKWTVRVTGDPLPRVTWLRDGIEIPDCEEVRIIDEGDGVHSLVIVRVEIADSGQFTCLAENVAGEVQGEHPVRNSAFTIENPPLQSAML
ncbi:immunoglobulin I-set domain protein [Ancylostoma ceylanicum]|uniref:Immunoglobulin I-set domain protein n=1 Tax=Ancylostoma ceylanicum TaxID=53326 RepID=A0A0D6LIR2_9BILA|nr:immunoglobulin I-set domain protein [Ancylostoma ceylanicum]